MRSLEVTDELIAAAKKRLQYTRDDGMMACLARAIVAQSRPEAPARTTDGCWARNENGKPCHMAKGHPGAHESSEGRWYDDTKPDAPAAQAGLPDEIPPTLRKSIRDELWKIGKEGCSGDAVVDSIWKLITGYGWRRLQAAERPAEEVVTGTLGYVVSTVQDRVRDQSRLQAAEPQGEPKATEALKRLMRGEDTGVDEPEDGVFCVSTDMLPEPAQRPEPAVTTENLEREARLQLGTEPEEGLASCDRAMVEAAKRDIRANLSRAQAEHDRAREADRRRIEELEERLAGEGNARGYLEEQRDHDRATISALRRQLAEAEDFCRKHKEESWASNERASDLRRQLGEAQADARSVRDAYHRENEKFVAEHAKVYEDLHTEHTRAEKAERERDGARNELATHRVHIEALAEKLGTAPGMGFIEEVVSDLRAKVERGSQLLRLWMSPSPRDAGELRGDTERFLATDAQQPETARDMPRGAIDARMIADCEPAPAAPRGEGE